MPVTSTLPTNLAGWLAYIEALHPKSIAMGLERVKQVKDRLELHPEFPVIIVAGTNGKGSTCAMLERIYHEAGYAVACYTSPHLLEYNERVRVACENVADADLIAAFTAVEMARQDTQLTYFEYGTLAAIWLFMQAKVEIAILEVGLGGRLDAVNVFDPSCAIVTGIDLDHIEFLGNSRATIGYEKAGVFRHGVPAICGDNNPPASLVQHAKLIGAELALIGHDFSVELKPESWVYLTQDKTISDLPFPALMGRFQLNNAACAISAVQKLQASLPIEPNKISSALKSVKVSGRFQQFSGPPTLVLDVAHNPQAAAALANNLELSRTTGKTLAVFAMLADKDVAGVIRAVGHEIDQWFVASIQNVRGAQAEQLAQVVRSEFPQTNVTSCPDVSSAYHQACLEAGENDRIVVFGSFFTVADVMRLQPEWPTTTAVNQ